VSSLFTETFVSTHLYNNQIGGVMASVLALIVVDRGLEPRSGQTKDYKFWYLLLLRCSLKKKEQRLVGSESD
jgi:hypothetical protein